MKRVPGVAVTSSRINELQAALVDGPADVLDAFWDSVAREGAPLIEPVDGEPLRAQVTFVWRGSAATRNVVVVGGVAGFDFSANRMIQLSDTDVWARTYEVPSDTRTTYWLSENDSLQPVCEVSDWPVRAVTWKPDPLNPRTFTVGEADDSLTWSVLECPNAPKQGWASTRRGVPSGEVHCYNLESRAVGGVRSVWLYTPPLEENSRGDYNLLVLLDGAAYLDPIPTPTILDNLRARGRITPTAAVLVESSEPGARTRELTDFDALTSLLADELIPWAHKRCAVTSDPSRTVIGGSSLGGLAAAVVAMRRPEVFGCVLSQSGAYWWSPRRDVESLPVIEGEIWAEHARQVRFYLEAGTFEAEGIDGDTLAANQRFRDALARAGATVHFSEFSGGHDYLCWRESLSEGLAHLLPQSTTPRPRGGGSALPTKRGG